MTIHRPLLDLDQINAITDPQKRKNELQRFKYHQGNRPEIVIGSTRDEVSRIVFHMPWRKIDTKKKPASS